MDMYNSTLDFWTVYGDVYIDFHYRFPHIVMVKIMLPLFEYLDLVNRVCGCPIVLFKS